MPRVITALLGVASACQELAEALAALTPRASDTPAPVRHVRRPRVRGPKAPPTDIDKARAKRALRTKGIT